MAYMAYQLLNLEGYVVALDYEFREKNVNDFLLWFKSKQLNLTPGFQRQSVWTTADRRRLIQSVANGYPLPSVFLYERQGPRGKVIYDVIDGKQRLESIFMFMGEQHFSNDCFDVCLDLGNGTEQLTWQDICRCQRDLQHQIKTFNIQTVQVTGDPSEIIDLFVRINSTGKSLTAQERRHAQYYESAILKKAHSLVEENKQYLIHERILTQGQLDRMRGVELMLELMLSVHCGCVINKKSALDRVMEGEKAGSKSLDQPTLDRIAREIKQTMHTVESIFPDLRSVRMHNSAEFYSLFMVIWEMQHHKYVLNDSDRNAIAFKLLTELSIGVDDLRETLRHAKPAEKSQALFGDYLVTVQGDTDSAANRQRRAMIIRSLLAPLFEMKDKKRGFSPEQRRLLWNSDTERICPNCGKQLTWENLSVDHVIAWSKGGPTTLENAQLLCKNCNSSKGNK